jgi:hypothetical protein
MSKDGYDPSIKHGVQKFSHLVRWATVCYWGSALTEFHYGDRVFFQNQYREYWLGTIERDCFVLTCETPLRSVIDGLAYLSAEHRMNQSSEEDDWFCDQGELPF